MDPIVYHAVTPATRDTCHYFFARTLKEPADTDGQQEAKRAIAGVIAEDIFATEEIERLQAAGPARDLLTAGDVAMTKGRLILQAMMRREAEAAVEMAAE